MTHYEITFFSPWHCGSGQAAGADVDELVVKDCCGLPFVPGRTVKGLLSDACDELACYGNVTKTDVEEVFGHVDEQTGETFKGCAFFSDATLPDGERESVVKEQLASYLYKSVAATAIDDNGIAQDHSLRKIQTVVPCKVCGIIDGVPTAFIPTLIKAAKLVKRLGLGRTHGLGRCEMTIKED